VTAAPRPRETQEPAPDPGSTARPGAEKHLPKRSDGRSEDRVRRPEYPVPGLWQWPSNPCARSWSFQDTRSLVARCALHWAPASTTIAAMKLHNRISTELRKTP